MVSRPFIVHHDDSKFTLEYDTDDGFEVLKFQIFSLTSIHPDEQKILVEDQNLIINESSDLESVTNNLRLVSIEEHETSNKFDKSDEELARILQAEEDALFFQQFQADENREEFEGRVRPHAYQVLMYEDPVRQEVARKSVPIDELEEKSLVSLAKEGKFKPSEEEKDHAFLLQLLFWFKQSFRWVNQPSCDNCGGQTSNNGMGPPLPSETKYGASRVEIYRCNSCSNITRFPRYNDPLKLLETRRGRCGEWANCFTLYCRSFGYDSRLSVIEALIPEDLLERLLAAGAEEFPPVCAILEGIPGQILDFTDHVWTECFSNYLGRWMHLDPCEGAYDKPLLYEKGWNKKLTYTIAISKDGVCDVTKRYTRKWHEVLSRRNITTEPIVASVLLAITKERRATYSSEQISALEIRDQKEAKELEEELHNKVESSLSLPGRQSGSVEWRIARSELGNNSLSSTSCPIRLCVDSHVKNIYNALNYYLHYTNDENSDVLATFEKLFQDLRALTYKERRSYVDLQLLNCSDACIECLLSSVSLKKEPVNDGKTCICLAGDPVQTALALPVAIDAINELVDTMKSNINGAFITEFPKRGRICSGLVLASGEELPFGIATSAFDGLQTSKWEEPDGAKGCWLIYKTVNSEMCELESYELMSANDAPERDPKDWILEGSDDGGVNWYELDKQSYQFFEKRFHRKTFKVAPRRQSNAFRFRFLSVRDSQSQSRFQIGSIDLYAARFGIQR